MALEEMGSLGQIDVATSLGVITLGCADLKGMGRFYQEVIGLTLLAETDQRVELGIGQTLAIRLALRAGGRQVPNAAGLFHLAFLLPGRAELGQWINHFETYQPLRSSADHLYSEAVYIDDPEGNVVEIYCDRPRAGWYDADGRVKMGTLALDLDGLRAVATRSPFAGLPAGTILGHIHLQVNDVESSMQFYSRVLGFDCIAQSEQAGFVGAGGYHHHIGFNTFHSAGRGVAPAGSLGLQQFTVQLTSKNALNQLRQRLAESDYLVTEGVGTVQLTDPSGISICFESRK